MIWFGVIVFITGLALVYTIIGRPYLKTVPGLRKFFIKIEPIEIALWSKSETILWARWRQFVGVLITVLAFVGTFDYTPFIGTIPYKYQWLIPFAPLVISASGALAEYLRRYTGKPLALVAVPDKGMAPEVKEALAVAEISKEVAVEVVKAAEAKR